jgi:UDP-glucuronate 4-epimerase
MNTSGENQKNPKKILVTGAAGFIGFHLSRKLVELNFHVVGLDNINDYYDVNLKYDRLEQLGISKQEASIFLNRTKSKTYGDQLSFVRMNLEDEDSLPKLFQDEQFDVVCNLAAQAGVRYSLENPKAYIESNINGFLNILECCRHYEVDKLVYASSSSVYGNSDEVPFKETQNVDNPISLYAATKKSNELMAHTYSHLYGIQTIGLRFFTVYGPWGRPDMAMFLFTDAIINRRPIKVFNHGNLSRDFTYIDDIVKGVIATLTKGNNQENYQLYNIGNSKPVQLMDFITEIEKSLSTTAIKEMHEMQAGDVYQTYADVSALSKHYQYAPETPVSAGVRGFVKWYKKYYAVD